MRSRIKPKGNISAINECSVICGPIGCAVDFVCRLLHLKIISLKKPLQIGLCNKADSNCDLDYIPNIHRKLNNIENVLNINYGFGGTNSSLILRNFKK